MNSPQVEESIILPNGCILRPGGRIRMLREQIWKIPPETVEKYGLLLDDAEFSPASEVVIWPKPKRQTYIHLHRLPIDRVLVVINPLVNKHNFDGFLVGVHSLRLQTFKSKGVCCVACGLEGSYFSVDQFNCKSKHLSPHLNLWAINAAGHHILMTHDHIIPRSKGGKDELENTQTMCCNCNTKKADS